MKDKAKIKHQVALVARADKSRARIAKALRDGGYDVFECGELSIATRFVGVVVIDDVGGDALQTQVQSWLKAAKRLRVVVISSKPAAWRTLSLAHGESLFILAAPSFSWEIVDALRVGPPESPRL